MENKKCIGCGIVKPIDEFSWKNKKLNKKKSRCKICISNTDKEYYKQNPDRQKKIRHRTNEQIKINKEFFKRYKKFLKCSNCGDDRWYVIDFHHIRDKKYQVANMAKSGISLGKLKEEIRKCIPLCSNCHRELHHLQRCGLQNNKDS
jgi:hypothetical protein